LVDAYRDTGEDWSQAFAMKNLGMIKGSCFSFKSDESLEIAGAANLALVDRAEAAPLLSEAALIFEKLGDQMEQADSLRILGEIYHFDEPAVALGPLLKAKALFEELGDLVMAADISSKLAFRSIWLGDFKEGFAFYEEGRQVLEALGFRQQLAHASAHEALHALRFSGIDHARQLRLQCRSLYTELGLTSDLTWTLWELGEIERVGHNLDLALDYYQEANQLIEQEDMPFARMFYVRGLGDYSLASGDSQAAIGYFQDSLNRSRELSHHWARGYALSRLGRAYLGAGQLAEAGSTLREAIQYTQKIGQNDLTMIALTGQAALKKETGDSEQALILASFVYHFTLTWIETKREAQEVINAATGELSEETAEAARQQGLTMTKEEILEMIFSEENTKEV
jgi:tetratricopeptide (TPR) repeat protein